jgi:endonuclease-8
MPEGDTIFRAARALQLALAGRTVTSFTSVFPHLNRIDFDAPLTGRTVDAVESAGKHLLMWFSGGLVLRTHMRMNGSWHIYRPGERWQRPRHEMRIAIETAAMHAVAFSVPIAELVTPSALERSKTMQTLGPDLLADNFDASEAVARIVARGDAAIADALLDQRTIAGIGNIYKSEALFAARLDPFALVGNLGRESIERVVAKAVALMKRAAIESRTSRWVYDRAGEPCRRCGTAISVKKQGPHARRTYWCRRCQAPVG